MKVKKIFVLIIPLLLTACNNNDNSQNDDSIIVKDLINREVSVVPGSYKRVVCIGAGALRLYSYIGDIDLLCGVEDIDNESLSNRPKMFDSVARPYFIAYKDVFKTLPSCGVGGPNNQIAEAEKILSCNPDIVISEYEDVTKEDALQKQLNVPVITLRYGSKGVFDENLSKSLTLLGKIFNKEDRATSLNNYILKEKNDIQERVKNVNEEEKKNVYICGLGNWGTTNELMTSSNYEPFNVANIKNVLRDIKQEGNFKIEKEKFVSIGKDIDIMFIDAAAIKNIKPEYSLDNTMFSFVKAFNNDEVYLQMAYNAYYTNVELALANTWFNGLCVYPTLFSDINIDDKLNEITKEFLNMEMKDEIYSYANSFGGYQKIDVDTFFN